MTETSSTHSESGQRRFPLGVLLLAFLLLLVSNGSHSIALAAWLSPILLMRFTRAARPLPGFLFAYAALTAAFAFQFRGMIPVPGAMYAAVLCSYAAAQLLPYVLDRWLARRFHGLAGTLIFPLAVAATEYAASLGPYASWGSSAYAQSGNLPLLQILPITGLWGVSFLVAWAAPVVNGLWQQGTSAPALRHARVYAALAGLVCLAGGLRIAFFAPDAPTVRVAGLATGTTRYAASDPSSRVRLPKSSDPAEWDQARAALTAMQDDILARSAREADAGAKIILWPEADVATLKSDEPAFLERGRAFARSHQVYLLMAYAAVSPGQARWLENKAVLVEPDGNVSWEYRKLRPVPGAEAAISAGGDGLIHGSVTPIGRLGTAICFDADFPNLIRFSGRQNVDILLVPANDWEPVASWHARMAAFRGLENGFTVVREAASGVSAATDSLGRTIAASDQFSTRSHAFTAEVPTRGILTFYALAGDWFAWVACGLLILLVLRGLFLRPS